MGISLPIIMMSAFATSWTILLTLLQVQMAALNQSTRNMTKKRIWFIDDINASGFKSKNVKDEVHFLQKFGQIYAIFIDQTERVNKACVMQLFITVTASFPFILQQTYKMCKRLHGGADGATIDAHLVLSNVISAVILIELVVPCMAVRGEAEYFVDCLHWNTWHIEDKPALEEMVKTTGRRFGNVASPLPVDQLFGTRLTLTCESVANGGVAVAAGGPFVFCSVGTVAFLALDAPPGGMMEDSSRLHAVFSKLSGVLPIREDLGHNHNPQKTMSSDIIESVLAAANDTPLPTVPTNWNHRDASNNANVSSSSVNGLTGGAATPGDDSDPHSAAIVLLPCGLLRRIARDVLSMAECEPCGVRGCRLYVTFESNSSGAVGNVADGACIAAVHWDPATPATHELYLTLRQQPNAGWQFLPQVIRNLTRGGTVIVSPAYTLSKKKLYRSYREE
nr:unnamed protein product [Callosobruchus analis]